MSIARAAVAAAFIALPGVSMAQTATPTRTMTDEQAAVAIMAYYPAAARAAGVEGTASLKCVVNQHARLSECVLSAEYPAGSGFGEAALALSRLSKDNPEVSLPPQPPTRLIQFTFTLKPPSITPNTLAPAHLVIGPDFLKIPNNALLKYPEYARRVHLGGRVALDCVVTDEGKLTPCAVTEETPPGYGFGQAAVRFASTFKLRPGMRDGQPVHGGHYRLPMVFVPR